MIRLSGSGLGFHIGTKIDKMSIILLLFIFVRYNKKKERQSHGVFSGIFDGPLKGQN